MIPSLKIATYIALESIKVKNLTSRSLQKCLPMQKSLHLSLSTHSFLASSIHPPLPATLSYNWPFSPGALSFTHIHFLNKLFTLLSLNMTKSPQCISLSPFHYTTLHSRCIRSHTTSFIALTLPSCHATCSSQTTHFHSTHS